MSLKLTTSRLLTLAKGRWLHIFRYPPGWEGQMLDHICGLAEQGRDGLDWLDAATLCFQAACQAALRRQGFASTQIAPPQTAVAENPPDH